MRYKVLMTEMHTAEYHVDAKDKDDAIKQACLAAAIGDDPVSIQYNETISDRDSMYVVEMEDKNGSA
jgi:hypothetical protein